MIKNENASDSLHEVQNNADAQRVGDKSKASPFEGVRVHFRGTIGFTCCYDLGTGEAEAFNVEPPSATFFVAGPNDGPVPAGALDEFFAQCGTEVARAREGRLAGGLLDKLVTEFLAKSGKEVIKVQQD